ncbi:hypothetical protein GCM10009827_041730 [Dactylosporangium maewongense]|uniref:Uncharacterized protein n=1 Tax=Dactylosporangium maewongense TaxID=634393 RepID=A0ABP4LG46_9ACTN
MTESATIRHVRPLSEGQVIGILSAMPDERIDPSQNTQAFQAWVDNSNNEPAQPAATGSKVGLIVAGAVVAVVVIVVVVFALL